MKPEQLRRARKAAEAQRAAHSEALRDYIEKGGDVDRVVPELIPTEEDRVRLERAIRTVANQAAKQPKGARRNKKLDQVIPLVAELCVVERVLALDSLKRASLTPRGLRGLAHTSPREMHGKLRELVAGVVGGGDAPRVEVAR